MAVILYPEKGMGACKTIVVVCSSENESDAIKLARWQIAPGSVVMTDENPAYNQLSIWYDHRTVQHAVEFSTIDGVNDNQAESYFSRLRRYVLGVSHRIEPKYMGDIAIEMAWREDVRRKTEGEKLKLLLKLHSVVSLNGGVGTGKAYIVRASCRGQFSVKRGISGLFGNCHAPFKLPPASCSRSSFPKRQRSFSA